MVIDVFVATNDVLPLGLTTMVAHCTKQHPTLFIWEVQSLTTYPSSFSSKEKSFELKNWIYCIRKFIEIILHLFIFFFINWNWLPTVIFSFSFFSCFSFHTQFLSKKKTNIGSCKRQVNRTFFLFSYLFKPISHAIHYSINRFINSIFPLIFFSDLNLIFSFSFFANILSLSFLSSSFFNFLCGETSKERIINNKKTNKIFVLIFLDSLSNCPYRWISFCLAQSKYFLNLNIFHVLDDELIVSVCFLVFDFWILSISFRCFIHLRFFRSSFSEHKSCTFYVCFFFQFEKPAIKKITKYFH